jgi:hypothetical protein
MGGGNGLITKDKFCLSRFGKLELNWSRYEVYLKRKVKLETQYADDESQHQGGVYEALMASSPPSQPSVRWGAPLGSSLPTAHRVGKPDDQFKPSSASDTGEKT